MPGRLLCCQKVAEKGVFAYDVIIAIIGCCERTSCERRKIQHGG